MTKIEWTNQTWNPLAGCTRASAGCDNCYAASMALRLEGMANAKIAKGEDPGGLAKYIDVTTRNGKGVAMFNGKINLDHNALNEPLTWKKPRLVFVNSMSDLFHHNVPDDFICSVFDVIGRTSKHTYQVLTKRPMRMLSWQRKYMPEGLPANVWAGTSVENQEAADERIPELLKVSASVRFLSCEPLLGEVNIRPSIGLSPYGVRVDYGNCINWVIVGGESGHNARPMHPDWVRSLRDQCQEAGVPFFFKQWGEWSLINKTEEIIYQGIPIGRYKDPRRFTEVGVISPGGEWYEGSTGWNGRAIDPDTNEAYMVKVGKKVSGRLLDGREWNEMPIMEASYSG